MGKHLSSTDSKVLARIKKHDVGWVFSAADFRDLGSPTAVRLALMRQTRTGAIRSISRGLYDLPRRMPKVGTLPPSSDSVVQAVQGRNKSRVQPSGAHAANLLGLSTQVPVRPVYLTDGRSRTVQIGKQQMVFRHAASRQMAPAGRISGTVIQALRWLGRSQIDDNIIATLRRRLGPKDKNQLLKDLRFAPAWVAEIMRRVATEEAA